jgi:hypothetical protein
LGGTSTARGGGGGAGAAPSRRLRLTHSRRAAWLWLPPKLRRQRRPQQQACGAQCWGPGSHWKALFFLASVCSSSPRSGQAWRCAWGEGGVGCDTVPLGCKCRVPSAVAALGLFSDAFNTDHMRLGPLRPQKSLDKGGPWLQSNKKCGSIPRCFFHEFRDRSAVINAHTVFLSGKTYPTRAGLY